MASLRTASMEAPTAPDVPMVDEGEVQDISGLANSDIVEFREIWEEFCRTVLWYRCLNWMGGHHADAEDAMHTAAMRVCKYLRGRGDTVSNPQAWLHRLLYNQCMTLRRGQQRRQHYIQYVTEIETIAHASSTHRQESAEETHLQNELKMHIRTLIEALPDRLKEPLKLHFFQGMRQRDIAQYLNISHDNVRKRLQQARDILRGQLAPYLRGEHDTE
jgi:RNA polymerase sigma factor (sigma-70 family)